MFMTIKEADKVLEWISNARKTVSRFPKAVRQVIGQALYSAQLGKTHVDTKPLKGFAGAGVVEIIADDAGNTYRGIYTVKFAGVVYVLHAFQKKSKTGAKTSRKR
jgi:phage-related protein